MPLSFDHERRFGAINRLYHSTTLQQFSKMHVCIVGLGGVGSWAAETIIRAGIGRLTLIDLDVVAESNINRQLQATSHTLGMNKTEALAERCLSLNPACQLILQDAFIDEHNVSTLITPSIDWVIDAIDQVTAKAALISHCHHHQIHLITTGAAGGKTDPTAMRCDDLSRTEYDPLLARVKQRLRKHYHFPSAPKPFKVQAVYSKQPMQRRPSGGGLNCAGYGSLMSITASMGIMAAGIVIHQLGQATQTHSPDSCIVQSL